MVLSLPTTYFSAFSLKQHSAFLSQGSSQMTLSLRVEEAFWGAGSPKRAQCCPTQSPGITAERWLSVEPRVSLLPSASSPVIWEDNPSPVCNSVQMKGLGSVMQMTRLNSDSGTSWPARGIAASLYQTQKSS